MKLPKKIKLLDQTYKITYVDKPSDVDIFKRDSIWGQIDYWTRTIRIYKNNTPYKDIWHTIIHEAIHGIVSQLKLNFEKDSNERITDTLATGINSFLFDNNILKDTEEKSSNAIKKKA